MLWRSKSMSAALGPPRLPTRKTRLRRCGTGPRNRPLALSNTRANCESSVRHATKYPHSSSSSSRHPKSRPLLLERHPGTFSQTMYRGEPPPEARTSSRTARMYSNMSRDSPCRPARPPAMEKDWQGLPPIRTSTAPCFSWNSFQSILQTSPRFGTPGNLAASTAAGNSSTSANASGSHPSFDHATVAASTPLKSDTYLTRPPLSCQSFRTRRRAPSSPRCRARRP